MKLCNLFYRYLKNFTFSIEFSLVRELKQGFYKHLAK